MSVPLCFVLIPSGTRITSEGNMVDFDAVYDNIVKPAIEAAGMELLRADQDVSRGGHHNALYEQLILCDYAVADLSDSNTNLVYELGLRDGVRPSTTVTLSAEQDKSPFDAGPLHTLTYALSGVNPCDPLGVGAKLTHMLMEAQRLAGKPMKERPIFQLLEGYKPTEIARLKTDVFRDRAVYGEKARNSLAVARLRGKDAVAAVAGQLGRIDQLEAGVVIDLLLSQRAVSDWQAMIDLGTAMSRPVARTRMVQEQLAFALNRLARGQEAEVMLMEVIETHGASSETNGLLGRVYKDRWEAAMKAGADLEAAGWLEKAIQAYLTGFEADWRDAYPGINALTLMELKDPADQRSIEIMPIVKYSLFQRLKGSTPDYWDHASLVEFYVLSENKTELAGAVANALAAIRESWEPTNTAENLRLIRTARARRNNNVEWIDIVEREFSARS
jgi:hypothetical protein